MTLLQCAAVFLFALAVRLYGLAEAPLHFDEYYHVFAAHGWNEEGRLAILAGEYHRTALYTQFVAVAQQLLGDTLAAARFPSALFGAALTAGVFLWVRMEASWLAAWLAGLLVAISPDLIAISQMVRFYAPHGLLVLVAAVCGYMLTVRWAVLGIAAKALLAVAILVSLVIAAYLQPTTVIAAAGIAGGAAICIAIALGWQLPQSRNARILLLLLIVGGIVGFGILYAAGVLQPLWTEFRSAALWNAENRNAVAYYHWHMKGSFGPIWLLFPIAIVCAATRAPRLTVFCTALFAVAFILHSLAGMKNLRYIAWALPFFFIVWALAIPVMVEWVYRQARMAAERALGLPENRFGGIFQHLVAGGVVALAVLAVTVDFSKPWRSMGEVANAFVATDERAANAKSHAAWQQVRAIVADRLAAGAIVATPNEFLALHHLGRADVVISRSRLLEGPKPVDFTRDHRTGIPVISTTESMLAVMACTEQGLVVVDQGHFPVAHTVTADMAAELTRRTTRVTPIESLVHVFAWDSPVPTSGVDCTAVKTGPGVAPTLPPALVASEPGATGAVHAAIRGVE